jgi:hypothetical protein
MTTPPRPTTPPPPPPPPAAPGGPAPEAAALWAIPATDSSLELPLRILGMLLALAVTDPTTWFSGSGMRLLLPLLALLGAWFTAPAVAARPVADNFHWYRRLVQQRNTAFTVVCVLLAAMNPPPVWLACCDTGLLLTYLLCLDAVDGGPPGRRVLQRPTALLGAYASSAVVLAAAFTPVTAAGSWARLLAALAVAATAGALAAAVRHGSTRRPAAESPDDVG